MGRVSTDARAIPVTLRARSLCMQCLQEVTCVIQNCCPNCRCFDTTIPATCPLATEMLACTRDPTDGLLLLTPELCMAVGQEMIIAPNQRMNPHVRITPTEINRNRFRRVGVIAGGGSLAFGDLIERPSAAGDLFATRERGSRTLLTQVGASDQAPPPPSPERSVARSPPAVDTEVQTESSLDFPHPLEVPDDDQRMFDSAAAADDAYEAQRSAAAAAELYHEERTFHRAAHREGQRALAEVDDSGFNTERSSDDSTTRLFRDVRHHQDRTSDQMIPLTPLCPPPPLPRYRRLR